MNKITCDECIELAVELERCSIKNTISEIKKDMFRLNGPVDFMYGMETVIEEIEIRLGFINLTSDADTDQDQIS